ncbi:Uncharacterized protein dnm_065340 [Desulfonema magnum]|uniref:Uncharacterized protein n=1 Tax=Desulfonema magnum TaxID=45655 RepID=A0A975BRW4_9BACT|nr:Uncharacterized protein dnm_065340 [Desulfonema magnum]
MVPCSVMSNPFISLSAFVAVSASGVQKFYFCICEKAFFALRKNLPAIRSTVLPRQTP